MSRNRFLLNPAHEKEPQNPFGFFIDTVKQEYHRSPFAMEGTVSRKPWMVERDHFAWSQCKKQCLRRDYIARLAKTCLSGED